MAGIKINLSDVMLVPEGEHRVTVEDVCAKESRAGSMYLEVRLALADGSVLFMARSFKETARHMLVRDLAALGIDTTGEVEFAWDAAGFVMQPALVGRTATAVVYHQEWEGETRAKVRRLIALDDAQQA